MKINPVDKLLKDHAQGFAFIHAKAAEMDEIYEAARQAIVDKIVHHALSYSEPYHGDPLTALLESLKKQYSKLEEALMRRMEEDIPYIAQSYYFQALNELDKKTAADILGNIDTQRIKYFIEDTYSHIAGRTRKMRDYEITRLRDLSQEVFRKASLTGESRASVSKQLLDKAVNMGNFRFIDSGGVSWNPKSYFNMLGRTVLMNAGRSSYIDGCVKHKCDTVRVTVSGAPCPACAVFENRLLSISGATAGLTTLDEAIKMGLFHPNCTHSLVAVPASMHDRYGKGGVPNSGYKPPPLSIATNKDAWKKYRQEHTNRGKWSSNPIYKIDREFAKAVVKNDIPALNPSAINEISKMEIINYGNSNVNGSYSPMTKVLGLSKDSASRVSNFLHKYRQGDLDNITFSEIKGMKTVCHEINHSKHHPEIFSKLSLSRNVVEVINEEHTLANFTGYMRQLGFDKINPEWQKKLTLKGFSYQTSIKNSRDLASMLGMQEAEYRKKVVSLAGLAGELKPDRFKDIFIDKARKLGYNKNISLSEILDGTGDIYKWLKKQ
jgi:hypothetical protein